MLTECSVILSDCRLVLFSEGVSDSGSILEGVSDSYFGGRRLAINGLLQFLVFAAITAAAKGANYAENEEDGSSCGQKNRGGRVLVGDHIHGVIFCKLLEVSVVSTSASIRVVVLS